MQCVILAGGLATRLRPITDTIPKSMVPVHGKPFLEYQIELLRNNGVDYVVLCIAYLADQIEGYFGDGARFGVKIRYSYEEQHLLGTGGAIRNAAPLLDDEFFVMYGDSYLNISYRQIYTYYLRNRYCPLLVVLRNQNRWDRSNVVLHNGLVQVYDKQHQTPEMEYIDYGLSILPKQIITTEIPEDIFYDLAQLYKKLAESKKLFGYEVPQRFYEIGSREGLREFAELVEGENKE